MEKIFNRLDKFGRIHHRYLNDINKFKALNAYCKQNNDLTEIAEGDLCWFVDKNEVILFMMHPYRCNRLPTKEYLKKSVHEKSILLLSDILNLEYKDLIYIIELKRGHGDVYKALKKLISLLEEKIPNRYWIDAFSPSLLRIIKKISPSVPTSLHTRLGVYGKYVIRTTFEFPSLDLLNIYKLNQADAITISYKYSPARFLKPFGAKINEINKHVILSGKKLIFGGVEKEELFYEVEESCALAAYSKFNKDFI